MLDSLPLAQQVHKPSPKSSETVTLPAATPTATSVSLPMDVHFAESKQNDGLKDATHTTSISSSDFFLKAIQKMYPETTIGQLSSNMAFYDGARVRAIVALKAFTAVKTMITDKKLVYAK